MIDVFSGESCPSHPAETEPSGVISISQYGFIESGSSVGAGVGMGFVAVGGDGLRDFRAVMIIVVPAPIIVAPAPSAMSEPSTIAMRLFV